jgi:anti-sigma factor RsiW
VNCQSLITDFLHDYHAGTLSMARRMEFDFHLTLCRACRQYVDSYKKTVTLARTAENADVPDPPPELVDAILKLTRDDKPAPPENS